jgi:uncharacterized protein (TIGR00369 family)
MAITSGCATLQVADFDRAISFYTETLGLKLIVRFGDEWACMDAGEGMLIGLIPCSEGQPTGISVGLCASEQFDSAVENLCQWGITIDPQTEAGGAVRLAHFADPDGNPLYLTDSPPDPTAGFAGRPSDASSRPFFEYLGLRWNTVEGDRVTVELDLRDDLRGPTGNLQGGIIATLVDVAAASTAALAGTGLIRTTEMTVHYLVPGKVGPVRAVGELLRSGSRIVDVEVRVFDAGMDGRLMAVALTAFVSESPDRRQKIVEEPSATVDPTPSSPSLVR